MGWAGATGRQEPNCVNIVLVAVWLLWYHGMSAAGTTVSQG